MNVILSKNAHKQYERLSGIQRTKVRKKLEALSKDAYAGKKLVGELSPLRSLKVWPYRIIYEVNDQIKMIEVHKIAHRQGVYK